MSRRVGLLLTLAAATLRAGEPVPDRQEAGLPLFRAFSPREYGAGASNWAFAQDRRGVMYVGNASGVLEFDGLRWRLIRTANGTLARSLAADATGRVYVGALGEIGYLEADAAGEARYVSLLPRVPPEARQFSDVWQTLVAPDGIYFLSTQRLFRLRGGEVQVWNAGSSYSNAFLVGERLFVREPGRGLLEMVGGRLVVVPGGERFGQERVYAMLPWAGTRPGGKAILVGSRTQGFFLLEEGSFLPYPTGADAGLLRDRLYSFARLADGTLALGTTQGGVYFLDSRGRWTGHLDKASGLADDSVWALFADREGGLWMGLDRGIVRMQSRAVLTRFDERSGLGGTVFSIHRHLGRLYAGTNQGMFRLEPGPEARFQPVPGVKSQTWAFLSVGDALVVANLDGVYEVRGDAVTLVRKFDGAGALAASPKQPGRVFVGLRDGLASLRREGDRWVDEGRVPGVSDEIRLLEAAPDGSLWGAAQATGILHVTFPRPSPGEEPPPARVERFDTSHGLPAMSANGVFAAGDEVLFATERGVYRFDGPHGRFEPDPRFGGLFPEGARTVHALTKDRQGRVWMTSSDESVTEAGAAVPAPDGSFRWDPRPLRSFAGASIVRSYTDDDGVVWLGGDEGLFRIDAGSTPAAYGTDFTALVRLVSHLGGGKTLFGGSGAPRTADLAYADNALRFEYAAPSFDGVESTRFQVFLEGYDRGWSPWTAEGYREYTNLREGAYRFRVRARNLYGTVSGEAGYALQVRPPGYRTAWAYLLYVLAAAALLWGTLRWRERRLRAEKRALEETVASRTGELRAKNDQLETLNAIVKSINERLDFDELLEAILRECRVIRGVEKAAALVRLPGRAAFAFRAALGFTREELGGIELELSETEARYTLGTEQVSEDIFLVRGGAGRAGESKLRQLGTAKALLVLRIRIEGQVEGYLVFENQKDPEAFDEHDLDLLKGLREHFVSAFQKARAREAAEEARARAEEANRAKSVFLASMSHELRTPLNGVLGFAQLMDRAEARSPQDRQHLAAILKSGEHLLGLINDVLSLSKIEAGRVTLDEGPLDLGGLVADVCQLVQVRAEAKDLWLRGEAGDMPRAVRGDAGKLRQILLNLLGNAVKFTERGGVTLRVGWAAGRAVMEVEDTGPGIAPEEIGNLFAPFVQTETGRRSKEGTGLGLALSRLFARLMGGDLTVRSVPGRGTTFHLEVSLPADDEATPPARGDRRRVKALAPGQPAYRVLVVDDLADNRALLAGLLSSVGFEVLEAAGGEEAIARVRDWKPHFVWMDKRMPGIDGLEATRRIREEERRAGTGRVPIVALSASALEHEREEILASGVDDFVAKPFREGLVLAKMADLLGVTYAYEDEARPAPAVPSARTVERLARAPREWLAQLRAALSIGDTAEAAALTARVESHDPALAAELSALLAAYRLDELDDLVRRAGVQAAETPTAQTARLDATGPAGQPAAS